MKSIILGNQKLKIKDYFCSTGDEYPPKRDGKLWLYVNLTDICNGSCPFCINPCVKNGTKKVDIQSFHEVLQRIKDHVYGVSVTGGEPMLFPKMINEIIGIVDEEFGSGVEMDIVTNGTDFAKIPEMLDLDHLDSVHLSRHAISDEENNLVFGFPTATSEVIASVLKKLDDPAQIVLNCVLMSGGIDNVQKITSYLDFASELGVRNVSFIGLSRHNKFCEEHYIDPNLLDIFHDPRFHKWNGFHDHDYCSCCSGSYDAPNSSIRFYYRRLGNGNAPYARNLVYTADNRLLAGFSGNEIKFGDF